MCGSKGKKLFLYKKIYGFCERHPKIEFISLKFILLCVSLYLKTQKKLIWRRKSVLFVGHCYYNSWYLSRSLRKLGWKADVLNWDENAASQIYYHGEDFRFLHPNGSIGVYGDLFFYLCALLKYEIFHFSNMHGIQFGSVLHDWFSSRFGESYEIYLLKSLGKKIVYSNNGCLDGVSQTAFSQWAPESVCTICRWQNEPSVCNDSKNLAWGKFRNQVADYQCLYGGNRADYNISSQVHEVPEFYCLNEELWNPDIIVPASYRLKKTTESTIFLYHAVGNRKERTSEQGVNIKSSHVYLPLIEKLRGEGFNLELISPEGVPNKEVRYLQVQADIFLEMLTYGWYGANVREAMMLGKPVICFIRPEWLESLREELPECAEELPIINATPATVESVLRDLIVNPDKRREVGERSRHFALKWHSDTVAGKRFDDIYSRLLKGDLQLRNVSMHDAVNLAPSLDTI